MSNTGNSLPPFIIKLINMLEDRNNSKLIQWSDDGTAIVIMEPAEFASFVLPRHFKHTNLNSFIRQLNKYNFHKRKSSDQIRLCYGEDVWIFANPYFIRNRPDLISQITRKKTAQECKSVGYSFNEISTQQLDDDSDNESLNEQNIISIFHSYVINFARKSTKYFDCLIDEMTQIKRTISDMSERQNKLQKMVLLAQGFPYYKVLIAEDNSKCSLIAYKSAQSYGFEPVIVDNIRNLFSNFKTGSFELIILSAKLPNINKIIEKIRIENSQIPIILTCSEEHNSNDIFTVFKGINGVIYKPYAAEELFQTIKRVITSFMAYENSNIDKNIPKEAKSFYYEQ
ncbi:HFB2A [Hepatospora eriocheir]|uniref:HFB2A n=1 Tax=Hepatospora eriocheir TaxID=1081669 RepID=A0A1X0QKP8_9MICR|nr:HFB2A [Hepatospora eriocheir]